jgi:hypothetical protein
VKKARETNAAVRNVGNFRPSAREGGSLVARLLRLASASSPDALTARGKALAAALKVEDARVVGVDDALVSVLLRPTVRELSAAVRYGRNAIVSVYTASQFVTAAAHADSYPRYPILLLRSMSFNIRRSLEALTVAVEGLDDAI